ncbi:hypothetical protein JCM6882_000702 [Rhodosporidiobolus microsporus]
MSSHPRQRQHSAPSNNGSTAVTLHFKERNSQKQPLYRPAALRRNGSVSVDLFAHPSPPGSPSLAAAEVKTSWLSSLAPWSPSTAEAGKELSTAPVRGRMLPRAQWKPDEAVEHCADPDCKQRFDLLNRRHHCRTCGDIFCASHSSRSTLLWPSSEDDSATPFTPRGTPRATPRSSSVDLPSLAYAAAASSSTTTSNGYSVSPTSSYISTTSAASSAHSSAHSSTPTSSPPNPSSMPVTARVCDRCYFAAPPPSSSASSLAAPSLPSHVPWAFSAATFAHPNPLTLRHPRTTSQSRSRSRASSPHGFGAHGTSPPSTLGRSNSSASRSRQGSAASAASSSSTSGGAGSEYSTPSTSVEGLPYTASAAAAAAAKRAQSPATSLRAYGSGASLLPSIPSRGVLVAEEGDATETEEDERDVPTPHALKPQPHPPVYVDSSDSDEDGEGDSDDEARHDARVRERRRLQQEFGSVQGGPWQSWATF